MTRTLQHKVAVVTGGAAGIGNAIARRLLADGATVVITDIDKSKGSAEAGTHGLTFLEHDVCSEADWKRVVSAVEDRFGRLDILVNNAGIIGPQEQVGLEDTPLSVWRRVFAVNVDGVFLGCRAAIAAMKRNHAGVIVNISSIAGFLATPYNVAYGASKAAVLQITKSIAQHCAELGLNIRCNSVHPGDVLTPLWEKSASELARQRGVTTQEIIAEAKDRYPLRDFVGTEDVAAAVAFLASDEARHITGTRLVVDCGLTGCDTFSMMKRSVANYSERDNPKRSNV
jgi:NAD(P)-dependent dehydrogenase (short-subunit alcohol dehydrogenase family)